MSTIYNPEIPDHVKVIDLTPVNDSREALGPETSVYVINRGNETLVRKFDGLDYPLHPHTEGLMKMPYGAALHFQKHCTVPGTRDAASGAEESYLGIIGVDPEHACRPFTSAEEAVIGTRTEALARDAGDVVEPVSVNAATASGKVPVGRGQGGRRPKVAFANEGVTADGTTVARADVLAPPDETAEQRVERLNAEAVD